MGPTRTLACLFCDPKNFAGVTCPTTVTADWTHALDSLTAEEPEAYWQSWTGLAEAYLISQAARTQDTTPGSQSGTRLAAQGRGGPVRLRRNQPSAPQVRERGLAATSHVLALRKTLTGLRRKHMYYTKGVANPEQERESCSTWTDTTRTCPVSRPFKTSWA